MFLVYVNAESILTSSTYKGIMCQVLGCVHNNYQSENGKLKIEFVFMPAGARGRLYVEVANL